MINPIAMKAYDEYFKIAEEYKITMVQLAQAFVNSRPFVTSNIIGATKMDQLKENIESINISLNENRGLGYLFIKALDYSIQHNFDIFVVLSGNDKMNPADFQNIWKLK